MDIEAFIPQGALERLYIGSGPTEYSQNSTVAASAIAETKVFGHLS